MDLLYHNKTSNNPQKSIKNFDKKQKKTDLKESDKQELKTSK